MKIVCEKCGSKYSVDDSKVQNKSFKITCKKCSNKIIIDNTKKEESFSSNDSPFDSQTEWGEDDMTANMGADMEFDDQATKIMSYEDAMKAEEARTEQSFTPQTGEMDFDDEATKIMSSSDASALNAQASSSQTDEWYVHIDGQQVGPLSLSELQNKIKNEKLSETTNAWKTGMADWSMIKSISDLASYIAVASPPDPFGASDAGAFGNDSLLDDNDAESLFNDTKEQQISASSLGNNDSQSDPFGGSGGFGGGLDLKSLIDQEDLEEDEEDDSSKSKVIDFRDIQGNNNKKIVVQHASFNASTSSSGGGNKGLLIGLIAAVLLIGVASVVYFGFIKDSTPIVKKENTTKLILTSNPSGALIYLNGELNDNKTNGVIIKVKAGKYQLKLTKDGYQNHEEIIEIGKDNFIKKFTLKAKLKEITIKTGLVEADITVGTEKLKTNPNGEATLKVLPASSITVKVEKDGKEQISTTINVTVDGDAQFDISSLTNDNKNTDKTKNTNVAKNTVKKNTNKRTNKKRNKKYVAKKVKKVKKVKKKDNLDDLFNDTPKKKVKVASNLPKKLSQKQVLSVIKRTYPKVKSCGKRAGITGVVKVKFKINGSGSVSNIKVAPNGGSAKNCIYSKVRSMRFPKFSGKSFPVTFPFKM